MQLRKLAFTCKFTDVEKELKSTIIQNCQLKRLRRVALNEDLCLNVLLDKTRLQEASEEQAKGIESIQSADTVNLLGSKRSVKKCQPARINLKVRVHVVCMDIGGLVRMAIVQQKVKPVGNVVNLIILLKFVFQSATKYRIQIKDLSHCPEKIYKHKSHVHHLVSSVLSKE